MTIPRETLEDRRERIEWVRGLSQKERAELVEAACRAAAKIEASRETMGLPPVRRRPLPASTVEFLRRHAPGGLSKT